MQNVFTYTSYRELIRDFYEARKAENQRFSYQVFSQKAGLKAKTYLINVVSGKKPLSRKSLFNIAKAMELTKRETVYFETLVNFNNSKTIKEKEYYFEGLKSLAGKTGAKKIGTTQFAYFSQWYHAVVRELVAMKNFDGNFENLARKLVPRITPKQAKESVQLLLDLGLIKKTAAGKFRQNDTQITTGDELHSLAVVKHQQETLKLATEALERIPAGERDISTITAGVSLNCFASIKSEIQNFRKHLLNIIEEDRDQEIVCQINFQSFPLSEQPRK